MFHNNYTNVGLKAILVNVTGNIYGILQDSTACVNKHSLRNYEGILLDTSLGLLHRLARCTLNDCFRGQSYLD